MEELNIAPTFKVMFCMEELNIAPTFKAFQPDRRQPLDAALGGLFQVRVAHA